MIIRGQFKRGITFLFKREKKHRGHVFILDINCIHLINRETKNLTKNTLPIYNNVQPDAIFAYLGSRSPSDPSPITTSINIVLKNRSTNSVDRGG